MAVESASSSVVVVIFWDVVVIVFPPFPFMSVRVSVCNQTRACTHALALAWSHSVCITLKWVTVVP